MIFVKKTDGTYSELKELPGDYTLTLPDDLGAPYEYKYPDVALSGDGFQFTVDLDRDGRKVWAKVFQMQKYKATEWIFPRKKKRGSARRRRKERRDEP